MGMTAAEFYYILFDAILTGKNPAHGREGYYFLENGEYTHGQMAVAVAKALHKLGLIKSDEPVSLNEQELLITPMVRLQLPIH